MEAAAPSLFQSAMKEERTGFGVPADARAAYVWGRRNRRTGYILVVRDAIETSKANASPDDVMSCIYQLNGQGDSVGIVMLVFVRQY
jgi:hypothetical protein